jgi:glycine oxidase
MNGKAADYIIVGQGLAGSCLALQLLFRGKKILVIDRQHPNAATLVAAGLFNPITGRKMAKTWMADELFPYLFRFYKKAEAFTNSRFFHPMPLFRPFVSVEEQNEWMGRSAEESFAAYIDTLYTSPMYTHQVKNSLGGLLVKQSGYVNTADFCKAVRHHLVANGALLEAYFDEASLIVESNSVSYKGWTAPKIIYCTGEQIRQSKYFSWLPVRPLKGETLTIKTEEYVSVIYNRGVYVVPDIWKVGATYSKQDVSRSVTEEGRNELMMKLEELVTFPFTVTGQDWGFRPTSPDRRPMLGHHPHVEHLLLFNGLGTKGVSLAPYFSEVLTAWMEKEAPLNRFVNVSRYKSVYSNPALE